MSFLKNCWYVAALDSEVGHEQPIARVVIEEPLVLYRAADGSAVVFEDRCCHRWAPLSRGRLEGDHLRCTYHGFMFDPSGTCIDIPGQTQIPPGAAVRRYPAASRYGWVWVWMGDPHRADLALIPSAPKADGYDTVFEGFTDYIDYQANYELINDNLTDFTHLSYVHANSFGASAEWAQTRPKITGLERGIRVQRWIVDDSITPKYLPEYAGTPLRNWSSYDYLAPGVLLLGVQVHRPEAMTEAEGGEPHAEPLHEVYNWQAVTPQTPTTSRYFFGWGVRRSENRAAITPMMRAIFAAAFEEDRQVIQAQQRIWNVTPARRMVGSSGDLGLNRMRMVMQRLLREERSTAAAESAEHATAPDSSNTERAPV